LDLEVDDDVLETDSAGLGKSLLAGGGDVAASFVGAAGGICLPSQPQLTA